jgi:small subunit ribosomal protein S8e
VTVRTVRCRGGARKFRALRLDTGNFSWGSENTTHKTRILDVTYNSSNNELVRTRAVLAPHVISSTRHFFCWLFSFGGKVVSRGGGTPMQLARRRGQGTGGIVVAPGWV